jgi:hypothetical protein
VIEGDLAAFIEAERFKLATWPPKLLNLVRWARLALNEKAVAMPVIDAQIHLWTKGTTLPPHRARPYLVDEALRDMDVAGIDRALIHPPSWDPDSNELAAASPPGRAPDQARLSYDCAREALG